MIASSRRTTSGSKPSREISPLRTKPVSYVMPLARMRSSFQSGGAEAIGIKVRVGKFACTHPGLGCLHRDDITDRAAGEEEAGHPEGAAGGGAAAGPGARAGQRARR